MATDRATADYDQEQECRIALHDNRADWAEHEPPQLISQVPPSVCAQCVNWSSARQLHLADGSTWQRMGYCSVRAAAELPQMSQSYAERCRFYEEDMPF